MAPTRASRGDGEKGIRGDMGPQTEPLGPVRVCWGGGGEKKGGKSSPRGQCNRMLQLFCKR